MTQVQEEKKFNRDARCSGAERVPAPVQRKCILADHRPLQEEKEVNRDARYSGAERDPAPVRNLARFHKDPPPQPQPGPYPRKM
jgi:hypothetical protein